jgi:hypothetical protein
MEEAFYHLIGLVFAIAMAIFGRFSIRNPVKVSRFFTFGYGGDNRFHLAWNKIQGWFFLVFGILGAIMYAVLIPIDLFSSR